MFLCNLYIDHYYTDCKEILKGKLIFLKKYNRESIIRCDCGKSDSISEYNEEDFLDNGKIRCIHK